MSVIPEFILQQVLIKGFQQFREDDRLVSVLFKNETQATLETIKGFIKNNVVDLNLTYPREEPKLPAIIMLLRNEDEEQAYLSDYKGDELAPEFTYDSVLGNATQSQLGFVRNVVVSTTAVVSATGNTVTVADGTLEANGYVGSDGEYAVHIISGTGAGQVKTTVSNTSSVVMISGAWETNPDSTSSLVITKLSRETVGEPTAIHNKQQVKIVERLGSLYKQRYQLQVIASSPEEVVILYTILKGIFTLSRTFLEGQGIINLKMGGTDLATRTEYVPDFSYTRNLNIDFNYEFDLFSIDDTVITDFSFSLCDATTGIVLTSGTIPL